MVQGATGDPGPAGSPGEAVSWYISNVLVHHEYLHQGAPGKRGEDGEKGHPGEDGDKGHQGDPGHIGANGEQVHNCVTFIISFSDCVQGDAGPEGPAGVQGPPGPKVAHYPIISDNF